MCEGEGYGEGVRCMGQVIIQIRCLGLEGSVGHAENYDLNLQ